MFRKKINAWELPRLPGETDAVWVERMNRCYYEEQVEDSIKWWNRIGVSVDLAGKKVLEIGCGHGALSINAARRGAIKVLGIDIDRERINFANANVRNNPVPGVDVSFSTVDLIEIDAGSFDVCISKDTFEHVIDMPCLMSQIGRVLADGGILITGFSPLYYSIWGDHGRARLGRVPWLHAILPERAIKAWLRFRYDQVIHSIDDLGLNRMTAPEFERLIRNGGWRVDSIRINQKERSRLMPVFNLLRRIRFLERFFTVNIYAVLGRGLKVI